MLTWVPFTSDWTVEIEGPTVIPPFPAPRPLSPGYLDRISLGLSRVIMQYQESPNFLAWIVALLSLEQDTEDTLQTMALQTVIDIAEGVNLYTIATIVGAPIVYTTELESQFIAFRDQPRGKTFWDAADPGIQGGVWRNNGEQEVTISELWAAQRLVIRCKILKNHSSGSGDSIQRGLMFLFPHVPCVLYDRKNMSFDIAIGRYLTTIEKQLISTYDVLPRPVGVKLNQLIAFDDPYFGFEDQIGASTFDIGHWANLEYWATPREQLEPLNIMLIPTTP